MELLELKLKWGIMEPVLLLLPSISLVRERLLQIQGLCKHTSKNTPLIVILMDEQRKWFLKTDSTPREDVVKTVEMTTS